MTLVPGTQISRYRVVARLGGGGMGEVYRARDLTLDRDIALKIVTPAGAANENAIRRFLREAQAASALNHPNIVSVFDVGECESGPFLVMELVEGRTLRDVVRGSPGVEALKQIGVQAPGAGQVAVGLVEVGLDRGRE